MKSRFCMATAVGALILVGACDLFTGPDNRMIGIIGVVGNDQASASMLRSLEAEDWDSCLMTRSPCGDIVLFAPDTVTAGEPFEIVVRTVAPPRRCLREDGAELTASPMSIEIVPYDIDMDPGGRTCATPDVGSIMIPRILELVFPEPGDAMLRLTGRVLIAGDSARSERFHSIDHPVVVR